MTEPADVAPQVVYRAYGSPSGPLPIDHLEVLRAAVAQGASDIHLAVPNPPIARIEGKLRPIGSFPALTPSIMEFVLTQVTDERNREAFHRDKELDCTFAIPDCSRFRMNAGLQRGSIYITFRVIPHHIPRPEELGLPKLATDLVEHDTGLVLVAGSTGSGKSTTMAALVEHLNSTRSCRIITVEDPIEALHQNKRAVITQRELGSDTLSFATSLTRALRQDPDVIVVGELRDPDTVAVALSAADTGHLVISTVHAPSAHQTIERILDLCIGDMQEHRRLQLAASLRGVIFQMLLPRARGKGRVAAFEVLRSTQAIRNVIRQNQLHQLPTYLSIGSKEGMQTLEQSLAQLVQRGEISSDDALARLGKTDEQAASQLRPKVLERAL